MWHPLGGDGINFQSFTELAKETINGHSIAESVVGIVNRVTKRIRAESQQERIVFGLHATSVENRLDIIDKTDPSVEILWEDCGGFPFALVAEMFWNADEPYEALVRRVRARGWIHEQ